MREAAALVLLAGISISCGGPAAGRSRPVPIHAELAAAPTRGPLRVSPSNPRYFADRTGAVVYLTGSHTWNSLQDWGTSNPPPAFDYQRYLDFMSRNGHNFFRLYSWEQAAGVAWSAEKVWFAPMPFARTGPGQALDGAPRFDLHRWNPDYFTRLRERVDAARGQGIYVAVMLFNGWSLDGKRSAMSAERRARGLGNPWIGHPFNRANNINGIDGDLNGDGEGDEVHTLANPAITAIQQAYLRKVIDTVGDLDNVLWEISNESNTSGVAWEYEIARFIKSCEAGRPQQHPVGMTAQFPSGRGDDLLQSPADWISPPSSGNGAYALDPPAADGRKVIVTDTDHIWGLGGDREWVWKSFTRGLNPIFMDPYQADVSNFYPMLRPSAAFARNAQWDDVRKNMGYTRAYAVRMNLAAAVPRSDLASTAYCLAVPGSEYLVYYPARRRKGESWLRKLPEDWMADSVKVNLSQASGEMQFEWFDPETGTVAATGVIAAGAERTLPSPLRGRDMALYLHSR